MSKYMFSKNVKILPWEGSNYKKTDPKILILGLSIYDKEDMSRNTAQNYIQGLIDDNWNYPFFTKIQNIFSNEKHWDEISDDNYQLNKNSFWNDFCFYEYIQERMNQPKEKTPSKYWENAEKPFIEVLKKIKPDIVLALGFETYNHLPENGENSFSVKYKENYMETWKYIINKKEVYVCKIQHPSSIGFDQDIWGHLFENFLNKYHKNK